MKLDFFTVESGNRVCPTSEGLIVAKGDMTDEAIADALENGDCRVVEGEWKGKPSKSILVGFGSQNTVSIEVKKLQARKSTPVVTVDITYLD